MKNILFFLTLTLMSCAVTAPPQMVWKYRSFDKNPQISLEQAKAICVGHANNAAANSPQYLAPAQTRCSTTGDSIFGYDTNCHQYIDPWANLSASIANKNRAKAASDNTFRSCMAQNGWNAYQAAISTSVASSKNKKIRGTDAAFNACVEANGNELISCRLNNQMTTIGFCDCKVNGGSFKK